MYEIPGTPKIPEALQTPKTLKILAIETLEIYMYIATRGSHHKDTPEISECRHTYVYVHCKHQRINSRYILDTQGHYRLTPQSLCLCDIMHAYRDTRSLEIAEIPD